MCGSVRSLPVRCLCIEQAVFLGTLGEISGSPRLDSRPCRPPHSHCVPVLVAVPGVQARVLFQVLSFSGS